VTRRLVSAGEVVVDLVLSVPALPQRGGDVIASSIRSEVGCAFNVMAAAARQGVPVTYAGLLGTGPMAELARAALLREGVDIALAPRSGTDTGTVVTLVEPDGERTFVTTLGAEAQLGGDDLARVTVRPDDVVHVSGYGLAYPCNGPSLRAWVATLPDTVTLVLDPGPLVDRIPASLLDGVLDRCDWLSANLAEARALRRGRGSPDPVDPVDAADTVDAAVLADRLLATVRAGVVVRLGHRGAVVAAAGLPATYVPPFPVQPVDLNGAGDAHVGSLVASIARDRRAFDPVTAIRRANVAAALAVTRHGPGTAPTAAEIEAFSGRRRTPEDGSPERLNLSP